MAASIDSPIPTPAGTYRFVVNSAEEAVRMIHAKLGPDARVISVKQVGARGFTGMLRAPQLEVIAEVTPPPALPAPVEPSPAPVVEDERSWLQAEPAPAVAPSPANEPLERILARAGIGEPTLARWRALPRWDRLCARPLGDSLKEVVELLRARWHERRERPPGSRVAFFGPPGSGSTTALCKALTMDVFFRHQAAVVIKLDGDEPNPTEGLAMFCEALDVPLLRSADELETIPHGHRCYFDAIGPVLRDRAAWQQLGKLLGEFYADTRVLVLNAAYDLELLKRGYTLGREAGATHVVFTHLDEVHHWGKLWDLLLEGGLQPLFFSCGQHVSGDLREDTFGQMVAQMLGGRTE